MKTFAQFLVEQFPNEICPYDLITNIFSEVAIGNDGTIDNPRTKYLIINSVNKYFGEKFIITDIESQYFDAQEDWLNS